MIFPVTFRLKMHQEVRIEGVSGILEFDQNRETHAEMKFVKMEKDGSLVVE